MKNELEIETKPISYLRPDPNNARKHDAKNIDAIAKSLARFGQRKPIVIIGDGTIVAGNGTVEAAKQLGWTEIACARVPWNWTAEEVKAYALADNRTAELAEWDPTLLAEQLLELDAEGWDVSELGFEALEPPINADADDDSPLEFLDGDPITKLGDLYRLGEHLLFCGDATASGSYQKLMLSEKAKMMFTDPPWNVAIGKDSNPRHRQREGLQNDDLSPEQFSDFLRRFAEQSINYLDGDIYCVLGASEWPNLDLNLRGAGYHWSATVIWVKDVFVLGRSKYHRRYEPIWYGWSKDGKSSFQGRRDLDDVWEIPRPRRSEEHPTMKPIELMIRAIRNSSKKGEIVLDPFGGSGSTLIAAEQTGRKARMIELDPKYCDVIITRWQNLTGQSAELVRD